MNKHKILNSLTLFFIGLTSLSFLILISSGAQADSIIDQVSINVPVSCTMSGTGMTSHNATIINGTYSGTDYNNGIGTTTLKVFCNDSAGFAIYAIGYTNDEYGNNLLHWDGASSASDTTHDIETNIYDSTNPTDSTWSMKLSAISGTYAATIDDGDSTHNNSTEDFTDWHEVPDEYQRVAYKLSGTDLNTDNNGIGSSITTTYDAYISQTQPAGTYIGQVKYTLVHPGTITHLSTTAVTAVFQAYPGDSIAFADGTTENTMVFRQMCEDESDSDTCTFIVTDGEYKTPVVYKGAWMLPMPDGEGGYALTTFEIQDGNEWIAGLNNMGGSDYLGQTIPIYAYSGEAVFYNGNGATAGDMSKVASRFGNDADLDSDEALLIAPNYYKTGYSFIGWSTSNSATPTNGATIYGPNETVRQSDFSFDSNGIVTLYAVWLASAGNMQGFSCSTLGSGNVTSLTDTRDGNIYAVGKLADGNCWMMNNLRLDGSAVLNSNNTNNPAISNLGSSKDNWCSDFDSSCFNQSTINTNNTKIGGVNSEGDRLIPYYSDGYLGNSEQWYGYGNYYNWYAATAGNGTYALESANAAGDICPAGWHLPSGTSSGDFADLSVALGGSNEYISDSIGRPVSKSFRVYPNNFVFSGDYYSSRPSGKSWAGNYWTSTAYSSDLAHFFQFHIYSVNPGSNSWEKFDGLPVRCLTEP